MAAVIKEFYAKTMNSADKIVDMRTMYELRDSIFHLTSSFISKCHTQYIAWIYAHFINKVGIAMC